MCSRLPWCSWLGRKFHVVPKLYPHTLVQAPRWCLARVATAATIIRGPRAESVLLDRLTSPWYCTSCGRTRQHLACWLAKTLVTAAMLLMPLAMSHMPKTGPKVGHGTWFVNSLARVCQLGPLMIPPFLCMKSSNLCNQTSNRHEPPPSRARMQASNRQERQRAVLWNRWTICWPACTEHCPAATEVCVIPSWWWRCYQTRAEALTVKIGCKTRPTTRWKPHPNARM